MADISSFLDTLRLRVKTAADPTLTLAVRSALRDFCRKTSIWRDNLADITFDPNQASPAVYALAPAADQEVLALLGARVNGGRINITRREDIERAYGDWTLQEAEGAAVNGIWMIDRTQVHVFPLPTSAETLSLWVSLQPTLAATTCADFLFNDWHDAIVQGALAHLLMMQGWPWYSVEGAALARGEFQAAIDAATVERIQNRSAQPMTATVPFFAG